MGESGVWPREWPPKKLIAKQIHMGEEDPFGVTWMGSILDAFVIREIKLFLPCRSRGKQELRKQYQLDVSLPDLTKEIIKSSFFKDAQIYLIDMVVIRHWNQINDFFKPPHLCFLRANRSRFTDIWFHRFSTCYYLESTTLLAPPYQCHWQAASLLFHCWQSSLIPSLCLAVVHFLDPGGNKIRKKKELQMHLALQTGALLEVILYSLMVRQFSSL